MSTADKTKNHDTSSVRGGLYVRLATRYRWIASVFARRGGFNHGNDLEGLNAHQLRDIGADPSMNDFASKHARREQARLNALMLLMGLNGR
ncbi:hypothetical protein H4S14_002892 [Agrobacterium vitis]|nr:hypothetical protein [Agrobacterium vitis]MBE1439130.1 hypothetical protein [Agrobacterium vitis]